jgi:hypothetical protein
LARSVSAPTPVQKLPSVKLRSEYIPFAVLYTPVVRLKSVEVAFCRVASGIAPVRWWADCLCHWGKRQPKQPRQLVEIKMWALPAVAEIGFVTSKR